MTLHLHLYTLAGRGIQSMVLPDVIQHWSIDPSVELTLPERIRFRLRESVGYRLTTWHEDERAGMVEVPDGQLIARVKSDGLVRDMKPIGATAVAEAIRREGVAVEPAPD